jgi:peptidoglycan/LPS O-acetylase OafA/YrhL
MTTPVADLHRQDVDAHSARMPHLPALDGLRGLAVIGVLLFHSGFEWAKGGFLGVSTFFTLSGFLITNLLVREWDSTGSIRLGRFWTRRFRRLLPAATITIALTGLVFWRIGTPEQLHTIRLDMLASLGYVANWRFYLAGTSYASLFAAPSPLQHFWSLAIEEQFYLFFPPIVIGCMRLGGRRVLTALVAIATLASVAMSISLRQNTDRVYYGTDTRASELLLGVLLALWWSSRAKDGSTRSDTTRRSIPLDGIALVALLLMFGAWFRVSESSIWLAKGGFPFYALCTTAIIAAGTRTGLTTALLSNRLLRSAGLISYGLYLYHWPVFLVLDSQRTGLDPWPLFALRMAVTLPLALVSYRVLEMPVRRGRLFTTRRSALTAAVAMATFTAMIAFMITRHPPAITTAFADVQIGDIATYGQSHVTDQEPAPGAPRSVLVLGDSGMVDVQPPLEAALHSAGVGHIELGAGPGFGLSQPLPWREDWRVTIDRVDPELVVVMLGGWDLRFISDKGDTAYQQLLSEAVDILSVHGARVIWLPMLPGGATKWKDVDDARVNSIVATLPTIYPGVVFSPSIGDSLLRPDGTFGRSYVDETGRTIYLRKADSWHMCQEGAARFTEALMVAAVREGLSLEPMTPWRDGPWVSGTNFDDPPDSCPR